MVIVVVFYATFPHQICSDPTGLTVIEYLEV